MQLAPDFEDFIKILNKHSVEYLVVGGYAMAFHGRPRFTGDLDIWINNRPQDIIDIVSLQKGKKGD